MRASEKLWTGFIAMCVAAIAVPAIGAPPSQFALMAQAPGGSLKLPAESAKTKTEQWLSEAKKAMAIGNVERAEYCITKAEALAPSITAAEGALNYTPKQARPDLADLQKPPAPANLKLP